jgi:Ca-activated chloride channel homolog
MKKNYIKFILLFFVLINPFFNVLAQNTAKIIREGNSEYHKKNYADAEKKYQEAYQKNDENFKSGFNLGAAYYRQEKFDEAIEQFQTVSKMTEDKELKAKSLHNLGNSYFKKEKYNESIEAYKNALKNNPKDMDTRKNLSRALQKLQEQQEQEQNKDKEDKEDKKDEEKKDDKNENKDKNENQENKDNKDQKEQEQPKKDELTKEEAERLLEAIKNDEEQLQQQLQKKKGQRINIEKDW